MKSIIKDLSIHSFGIYQFINFLFINLSMWYEVDFIGWGG